MLSLALARIGAVQSPVVPLYRDHEVGQVLRRTGAAFLAVPGTWRGFDHTAMAHRLAWNLPGPLTVIDVHAALPEADPAILPPPPDDGEEVRWIYWTSGTTAGPKGVLHTDRSLLTAGRCLAGALRIGPSDVGSMAFPYAHVAGPDYTVMLLLHGIPAVLLEHFALPRSLAAYRRHRVTVAGGSTAFYQLFLAAQRALPPGRRLLPSLRLLAGGGAPLPPELHHEVVAELGCRLAHGYAMTEAPMVTMGDPTDLPEHLATTAGRPPAGMDVLITPGTGEIRLRGPAVCRGYLDEPDPFDADGYLPTGDLGRLTPTGHLVVTGRLKDLIIRKGENISPQEIEALLHRHPDVADAAVIGLPDPARGERVCAVVEQTVQSSRSRQLTSRTSPPTCAPRAWRRTSFPSNWRCSTRCPAERRSARCSNRSSGTGSAATPRWADRKADICCPQCPVPSSHERPPSPHRHRRPPGPPRAAPPPRARAPGGHPGGGRRRRPRPACHRRRDRPPRRRGTARRAGPRCRRARPLRRRHPGQAALHAPHPLRRRPPTWCPPSGPRPRRPSPRGNGAA